MTPALELEAMLHGALEPTAPDRDRIVHALNERFTELGRNHPVPYSAPLEQPTSLTQPATLNGACARPGGAQGSCVRALLRAAASVDEPTRGPGTGCP